MLIPILFLGSVAAGSYAFLPSTWHKLRHKLRREKGVADPTLYLTFDDGPSPEYTPRLLDLFVLLSGKGLLLCGDGVCRKESPISFGACAKRAIWWGSTLPAIAVRIG